MAADHTTANDESNRLAVDAGDSPMIILSRRDKQKSMRDKFPIMNRSASNLSLASLNGEINDGNTDKLSRSLSRIRIRRASTSFKVDMAGVVVTAETKIEETKTNCETSMSERPHKSQSSTRDNLTLINMLSKPTGQTVLAGQRGLGPAIFEEYA
jgi:hypothetical protein